LLMSGFPLACEVAYAYVGPALSPAAI